MFYLHRLLLNVPSFSTSDVSIHTYLVFFLVGLQDQHSTAPTHPDPRPFINYEEPCLDPTTLCHPTQSPAVLLLLHLKAPPMTDEDVIKRTRRKRIHALTRSSARGHAPEPPVSGVPPPRAAREAGGGAEDTQEYERRAVKPTQ
ncbi:unnamed protein product [Arctogadus glacialis]